MERCRTTQIHRGVMQSVEVKLVTRCRLARSATTDAGQYALKRAVNHHLSVEAQGFNTERDVDGGQAFRYRWI